MIQPSRASLDLVRLAFFVAASGKGILVSLVAGECLLLSDLLTRLYFHDSEYYAQHGWPRLVALWAAAFIVWLMCGREDETIPGSELHTGRKPLFSKNDTLFFAPARYWPAILFGLGVLFYFA